LATGGHHVKNMTIQVSVKNNPFFQTNDATSHLYYNVRFKGHFGNDWSEFPSVETKNSSPSTFSEYISISPYNFRLLEQSSSEYTTFLFSANDYIPNASIDFQVEAVLGHDSQTWITTDPYGEYPAHYYEAVAFDETSSWSNTQTINIPEPSTSPNPTSTPTVPELSWLLIMPLLIGTLTIALLLRHRKNIKAR